MTSRSVLAACLLLATAACGPAGPSAGGDQPSTGDSAAATGPATAQRINPGRWQQTGSAVAAAVAATGAAETRCVSPEEALSANGSDDQIRAALTAQASRDGCTIKSITINGPTIAWTQTCSGADLTMTTDYHGDRSTTTMSGGGMPTMTTNSVRVGDC